MGELELDTESEGTYSLMIGHCSHAVKVIASAFLPCLCILA